MKPRYAPACVGCTGDLFSGFLALVLSLVLLDWLATLAGDNLDFSSFGKPLSCIKTQIFISLIPVITVGILHR